MCKTMLPNLVGSAAEASLGWLWPSWRSKIIRGQMCKTMLPNLVGRAADASLGWLWPSWRSKANKGQIQWITYVLPIWYLVSRWGLGPKVCMHHFGCGMNWIKGYYMIVKVKNETFWSSTYSMEMHSLTSSFSAYEARRLVREPSCFLHHAFQGLWFTKTG